MRLRTHLTTVVVAVACVAIAAALPALAHGVEHALFAHEAGEVDGFDATGAGTSPGVRAGKLVATNANGQLPNDIIRRAPDADRFDGVDSEQFRSIPLDLGGAFVGGSGVTASESGVSFTDAAMGALSMTFMFPPDRNRSRPASIDLVIEEYTVGDCVVVWHAEGSFSDTDNKTYNGGFRLIGSEDADVDLITLHGETRDVFRHTFRIQLWDRLGPDDFQQFKLWRTTTDERDTCGTVRVRAARLRY